MRSVEASLERLGLDRIDILLVHDLDVFTHGIAGRVATARIEQFMASGYGALVELRDEGAVRAIGVGVNEWQVCQALAERGDFDLFLLAGRYTLLEQEALDELPAALRGARHRHRPRRPLQLRHPGDGPEARRLLQLRPGPGRDPRRACAGIEAVCRGHGVPLIAAALQFPLHHPAVVSVIPGGAEPAEVRGNLELLAAPMPPTLWAELKAEGLLREDAPIG